MPDITYLYSFDFGAMGAPSLSLIMLSPVFNASEIFSADSGFDIAVAITGNTPSKRELAMYSTVDII
jgi:hypothetical protein